MRRPPSCRPVLFAVTLLTACGDVGPPGDDDDNGETFDAAACFPLETGRYWIYFDPDSRFLTLELTGTKEVVGQETFVLTWTFDRDTTNGEPVGPAYEQYFAIDPDQGVLLYGYKDYLKGESATFLPGVLFAGFEMAVDAPVETVTSASGTVTSYTATVADYGTVQTYYGDFPDALALTFGPTGETQPKHFLAEDKGLVKFDWEGVRFQLYDYGVRKTAQETP